MTASPADFSTLALPPSTLANLQQLGYTRMTAIQAASLPPALLGRDLIAQSSTGSGKTAAFGLALLDRLNPRHFGVQALVLCPTRELADQVTTEIRRLARAQENIKVVTLCGGVPLRGQIASLEHGAHVVVGTPGRVMDHLERGTLTCRASRPWCSTRPTACSTWASSTTSPRWRGAARRAADPAVLGHLSRGHRAHRPAVHEVARADHRAGPAQRRQDRPALVRGEGKRAPARRVAAAGALPARIGHRLLQHQAAVPRPGGRAARQGFSALALYGDLEQRDRDQVLVQFANRSATVLVATDVAARGLDIAQLQAVINVDVTPDPEIHIHRIGRTGRADAEGLALNLASLPEMGSVGKIEQLQGRESEWHPLAELTPAPGGPLLPPMATVQIVGGRKEKIRAGDVLGALTGEMGFTREQVGKINVNEFSTYVAVQRDVAAEAARRLSAGRVKGKPVRARLVGDD